jgi:phage protein D
MRIAPALAGLALAAALAGCGDDDARSSHVARLETELALSRERVASLERELAERTSREADAELTRMRLARAEARVSELESAPTAAARPPAEAGADAPAAQAADAPAAARSRLSEAMAALRDLDRDLADLERSIAAGRPDARAPRDRAQVAALAVADAARSLGLEPDGEDGRRGAGRSGSAR